MPGTMPRGMGQSASCRCQAGTMERGRRSSFINSIYQPVSRFTDDSLTRSSLKFLFTFSRGYAGCSRLFIRFSIAAKGQIF